MTYSPGTSVSEHDLSELGFAPHALSFRTPLHDQPQCEWDTQGDVPDAPGLYAFVLSHADWIEQRVAYVGMTTHLWMVTKGRLPRSGGARPAQRYGRHVYAGVTRRRVNALIAEARRQGCDVTHWLAPRPDSDKITLEIEASGLIAKWGLTRSGWNRKA